MKKLPTRLDGPILIAPSVQGTERGFFVETYPRSVFTGLWYYADETERGIAFDNPDVGIAWSVPSDASIPSTCDVTAPRLSDIAGELPFCYQG